MWESGTNATCVGKDPAPSKWHSGLFARVQAYHLGRPQGYCPLNWSSCRSDTHCNCHVEGGRCPCFAAQDCLQALAMAWYDETSDRASLCVAAPGWQRSHSWAYSRVVVNYARRRPHLLVQPKRTRTGEDRSAGAARAAWQQWQCYLRRHLPHSVESKTFVSAACR